MQKRARAVETQKLKRAMMKGRRVDVREGSNLPLMYIRIVLMWMTAVFIDTMFGIRLELLWPFWVIVQGFYENIQRNSFFVQFGGHTSTMLFVCVTATSDLICYLFIPVRVLIFVATTYVWMSIVWHHNGGFLRTLAVVGSGDRGQGVPLVVFWIFFCFFETLCRLRCDHLLFVRSHIFGNYLPTAAEGCAQIQGMHPPIQRNLNAFLGAHCIGYPLIVVSFNLNTYYKEWRIRRKQEEVGRRNEVLVRLLTEALPAEYDGPKVYRDDPLQEEDEIDDDVVCEPAQLMAPPVVAPPPVPHANGNARKTSTSLRATSSKHRGHPKKSRSATSERKDEDDECEDTWRENGSSSEGSSSYIIRFICDIYLRLIDWWKGEEQDSSSIAYDEEDDDDESVAADDKKRMNGGARHTNGRARGGSKTKVANGNSNGNIPHKPETPPQKNNNNFDRLSNGVNRSSRSNRDTSRESTLHEDTPLRPPKECGEECKRTEQECIRLRADLRASRSSEEAARLQAQSSANAEKHASAQLGQLQTRLEQIEAKLASTEKQRESDRQALAVNDRKLMELQNRKNDLERELLSERKARKEMNGVHKKSSNEVTEAQREKEKSFEREIDRLRSDSTAKDELIIDMQKELNALREYKAAHDIDELKLEMKMLREKNTHLEDALAAENKLKQELFRALGDAKANNEQLRKENSSGRALPEKHSPPMSNAYLPHPPPAYQSIDEGFPTTGGRPTCFSFGTQQLSSPTGEHMLFDVTPMSAPILSCSSFPNDPIFASRMGKFGAPSPANAQTRST